MPHPAPELSQTLRRRLRRVQLVVSDVDGVLTDGGVYCFDDGTVLKRFDIHDGLGIVALLRAGVGMVWLSGDTSAATAARAAKLGVTDLRQGIADKTAALEDIARDHHVAVDDILYIGDDRTDLEAMQRCGLAVAPATARPEIRSAAHFVTRLPGGYGAVREAIDMLLSQR